MAVVLVSGCTASRHAPTPVTRTLVTGTTTQTTTRTVVPPPARGAVTTVAPFPESGRAPKNEVLRTCPYIKAGLDAEPTSAPNIADLEGDRVGRITVLTHYNPVGCRFYFSYTLGDLGHEAVADILPFTLPTSTAAYNLMISIARAGKNLQVDRDFVKGVTGIRYQTRFLGPDGAQDWAFVFAKRRHTVVVHTQQKNASLNARNIAAAIAAKF